MLKFKAPLAASRVLDFGQAMAIQATSSATTEASIF
jgi:hypothetical protein